MNQVSGYQEFTLASGKVVQLKFCNATTEIYAKLMGFKTLKQVGDSLTIPLVDGVDEVTGEPTKVPELSIDYFTAIRMWVYSAAKYAYMQQQKTIDFTEWDAADWVEEIGTAEIYDAIDQVPESAKKKTTPRKQLIKPTQ